MSFDDYATHIYQKLRLAVALAIIRSKPTNKPTVEYLNELKNKMDDKMEDDDVTVCSDDFLMDDDDLNVSTNLLKDFDLNDLATGENVLEADVIDQGNDIDSSVQPRRRNLEDDLTQMTIFKSSQIAIPNTINPQNNTTICDEYVNENRKNLPKETTNISSHHKNQEPENSLHDSYHNTITKESNTAKMDSTYYDSQKTILYSVHGFTENYTHYSPSQTDMIIPQKYIHGVKENNKTTEQNNRSNVSNDCSQPKINNIDDKTVENPQITDEIQFGQNTDVFSQNIDDNFNEMQENYIDNNTNANNIASSTKNNEVSIQHEINIENFGQYSQNAEEFFEEMQNINKDTYSNDYQINNNKRPQCMNMENVDETLIFSQNNDVFSQNTHESAIQNYFEVASYSQNINKATISNKINVNNNNTVTYNMDTNTIDSNLNSFKNQESETATQDSYHKESNPPKFSRDDSVYHDSQNKILYNIDENNDFEDYSSKEIVSYKVLEEFNKVKTYLRRNTRMSCDGYSTDSGYRSDSQIRSSNRSSLQLTDNWLNQSACSLFNYIMHCPLVAATRDITNEIAQVLSQLIDKLHEEEKYPSFLEDLLETIDLLLKQIYNGTSSENEFLTTDENMQRILLLNKSIHIQQHSIEKISNILEAFHGKVTEKDTTYELTNIDEIENVSYMFHILEILLKKYLQNKDKFSQSSTQMSQEDEKILKKSSISDIWRKKWNPSQKVFEGSKEKKCVLKVCSNILNKIVVDCVSSYSLVAYSALKCFNSMQS